MSHGRKKRERERELRKRGLKRLCQESIQPKWQGSLGIRSGGRKAKLTGWRGLGWWGREKS